ncbi:SRPBCC family protein [Spirosoma panaciterrae]|uniref:SRPBCC family protein n=1 Tax=Spirosoma panaciterrae TaxID=496058 RepID=UPI00037A4443|nr:SRPBCC domain-containing protein [Spirosoma panaciterrae]
MRQDLIVSKSIDINASPARVWDVLTNPLLIQEYLFGTETLTDWTIGSAIVFQGEYENQSYQDKGIILENVPNQLLSYSYWSGFSGLEDKPENYATVTYRITEKGPNRTEFTWTQQGFSTEAGYAHSLNGMDDFLNQIKAIAER